MKFRKKPVEVDAWQLFDNLKQLATVAAWVNANGGDARILSDDPCLYIQTLEGQMRADIGDWIIQGVQGEFYPCKPDIFEATYEEVADDA